MISQPIDIQDLHLANCPFIPPNSVHQQDFEYGSVTGTAELIGFQIILFKKTNHPHNTALSVEVAPDQSPALLHIAQELLLHIAQELLLHLKAPLRIGDSLEKIERLYGKADYQNELYTDIQSLYYVNAQKTKLHQLGIHPSLGLTQIELIDDAQIAQERLAILSD